MLQVFSLRVASKVVGRKFPFDRAYLVRHADRKYIAQMFRYALVMPVDGELKKLLLGIPDVHAHQHTQDRNGPLSTTIKNVPRAPDDVLLAKTAWEKFIEGADWVFVLPLLPKWVGKNVPRYLMNSQWYATSRRHKVANANPYHRLTFLQTPKEKIRPVCVACPNYIMHQSGQCHLGERICLDTLPLSLVNHYEDDALIGEALPDPSEPIQEIIDGDL